MSKYNAVKTEVDGYVFDSKAEARRYSELKLLEKNGDLQDLTLQPVFHIQINGKKICKYFADFQYYDTVDRVYIVEDVKGVKTAVLASLHTNQVHIAIFH